MSTFDGELEETLRGFFVDGGRNDRGEEVWGVPERLAEIKALIKKHQPEKLEPRFEDDNEALYDWEIIGYNRALRDSDKAYGIKR